MTVVRRVVGLMCIAGAPLLLTLSQWWGVGRTCSLMLPHVGVKPTVLVCQHLTPTDGPVLLLLILGAVLLIPDISKIGIPGLFELERRIDEQVKAQAGLAEAITELRVTQQIGSQTFIHNFLPPGVDLQDLPTGIEEKRDLL